jgi:hypothetical protein
MHVNSSGMFLLKLTSMLYMPDNFLQLVSVVNAACVPRMQHPGWHCEIRHSASSAHVPPLLWHVLWAVFGEHVPSLESKQHPNLQKAVESQPVGLDKKPELELQSLCFAVWHHAPTFVFSQHTSLAGAAA